MSAGRNGAQCGSAAQEAPAGKSAGPISSKNIQGPTIFRFAVGNRRRTEKPPRSATLGLKIVSIALHGASAESQICSTDSIRLLMHRSRVF